MKKLRDIFKSKQKINLENLNKWNIVLAAVHALQGVLIVILSRSANVTVSTSYLSVDPLLSSNGQPVLSPATTNLFSVNLGYLVAAFFL